MTGWNWRLGSVAWITACMLTITLGACEEQQQLGTGGDGAGDAAAEATAGAALGGATDPSVTIVTPTNNYSVTYVDPGSTITMTVSVSNADVSPGDYHIGYYLDGVEVAVLDAIAPFSFNGVGIGRHHLAARLLTGGGDTLPNEESLDMVHVKVVTTCGVADECEDGLTCSNEACTGNVCNYGPVPDCCDSDFECSYNWTCYNNTCIECTSDADANCDDGDLCTIDTCDPSYACVNEPQAGCCHTDANCDDNDSCTIDSCDVANNQCIHVSVADPLCCNVDMDCKPADPCMAYLCYENTLTGDKKCRYGPSEPSCCTVPEQCDDGNPCTLNQCSYPAADADSGTCTYETDPATPDCCVSNTDCDDQDQSTLDSCVDNVCDHEEDPLYCELPATSAIVINEIMPAPGDIADQLGEWFEIYNASDSLIKLEGFTIETSAGESHTMSSDNAVGGVGGMNLFPGAYYVLGRTADSTLNGGFIPNYEYSGISLPDPFETGQNVIKTIWFKDADGALVDTVTYDTSTWDLEDGHSWALTHMHAVNNDGTNWRVGGTNQDPAQNIKYGQPANMLYGTPKNYNSDIGAPIPHDDCPTTEDDHQCAFGACNEQSQCVFPLTEGCCEADVDCNDFDGCTVDSCDAANAICNVPQVDPECCTVNEECDDGNPCNLDRCIGGTCRYSLNVVPGCCTKDGDCDDADVCTIDTCNEADSTCDAPVPVVLDAGQQCCNTDEECDDAIPSTVDICDFNQIPPVCLHADDPEYCDSPDALCDDGIKCTADSCDVGAQACNHITVAGCCTANSDCPTDNNPCTAEVCEAATGDCASYALEDCCISDNDCIDGNKCTVDVCGASNLCHHNPVDGCCNDSGDCDDAAPCTVDSCVDNGCVNEQLAECCKPGDTQAALIGACGPDPDGAATCFVWECTDQGQCNLLQNATCCTKDTDCDDGDPCSIDACTAANTCKHIQSQEGGTCCIIDEDCLDEDGKSCTEPICDAGICTELKINGCSEPVEPPMQGGPIGGLEEDDWDPGSEPGPCWKTDNQGVLGPDAYARCLGNYGKVGAGAILSGPGFNPSGHDYVSVQFNMAWDNGSGDHTVTVLVTNKEGDYESAEILDILAAGDVNTGTLYSYPLSNFMSAQTHVWVGWQVDSTEPDGVDVGVDDFVAATGHAPFFVSNLQTDKTYDAGTDKLGDGGTITGKLGEVTNKVYWAHDVEWNSDTLTFDLIGGPDFASIIDVAKLNVYGVWQVKVSVQAITASQIGSYDAVIRVSDGGFVDEIPVTIVVDLGAGYVLWNPGGVAKKDGDTLADALTANNATFQRVKDLSEVNDWTQVLGLFATAGGGNSSALLTNTKVKAAVDFLDDGGDVYLEGSRTWADDSQTPLQNRFKLTPVDGNVSWAGLMEGRSIHYGGSWEYTSSPDYLYDVDTLAPKSGSGARVAMADAQSGAGLAVTFENPSGARTYGASTLLSMTSDKGSTTEQLIGSVLDFFENGYGACNIHSECADGDACTFDTCVGGICQNEEDLDCDKCKDDAGCGAGNVCKANGDCVPMPGDLEGGKTPEVQGNCDTTDELIQVTKHTYGFKEITEVNTQIHLVLDASQKMGTMDIWLSHNGVKVHLVEPDATDNSTELNITFDLGRKPVSGSMNDFVGTLLEGPWILSIEDTTGGEACYTLQNWDIYVNTKPIGQCTNDGDCDNAQVCDGAETCDGNGNCQAGVSLTALDCADTDPCTKDKCDPFLVNGSGQCVSPEREPSCAGAPCSGNHEVDAGDGQCGVLDACQGGLNQGNGTCKLVCGTCIDAHSGAVDTLIQDFQCITEVVTVDTNEPYVSKVSVRADVEHANIGDISFKLINPANSGVTIMDGDTGDGLANFHSTFPDSNPLGEDKLCALNGTDPAGTWKLQICDNRAGSDGVLHSWSLWIGTTDIDPTVGQSCGNAVPISSDETEGIPVVLANSTQCFADSTMGSCTGADGHDVVYTFNLDERKRVTAELVAPGHDSGVYITDSCDAKSTYCADAGGVGDSEGLDVLVDPGTWYVVVDSIDEDAWGDYELYLDFQIPADNGAVCDENLDCKSGHCQNGFCCDSGDCCVEAGECPGSYTKSPTCDIKQTCQGHRVDPVCGDNICGTLDVTDDSACTEGTEAKGCGLFVSEFCSGEDEQTEPSCRTECFDNSDCDEGSHCYAPTSTCRLDNPDGAPCFEDFHCNSEFCADGVCCESSCDGLCDRCDASGKQGLCVNRKAFTDPENECAGTGLCGGTCDGGGNCQYTADAVACAECTRCDGAGFCQNYNPVDQDIDDSCDTCQVCDGAGACNPVPDGQDYLAECGDNGAALCNQDGACDGGLKYDGSTGTPKCRLYAPGTTCVKQSCQTGYVDPAHECNGYGGCVDFDDLFCDGHVCSGADCLTPCANDGECLTGYYCEDGSNGPVGTCQPKKAGGETCQVDHECKSNFCTDGVCCDAPCNGPCRQCGGGAGHPGSVGADAKDATLTGSGNLWDADTDTTGAFGTADGLGAATVVPIQLPTLPGDSVYGTANLALNVTQSTVGGTTYVDLYGLARIGDTPDIQGGDYYDGANDTSATKLQNDILYPTMPLGATETSDSADLALVDWLNTQYADGENAGKYVFLRLNGDTSPMPTGSVWYLSSSESGSGAVIDYTTKAGGHGNGECFVHESLTDPETGCGLYWCNGDGNCNFKCDPATNALGGSSDCKEGHWCNGGACEALGSLGDFCTGNDQCASTICNQQDNVCCDSACTSACESCKIAGFEGNCKDIADGADPDEECNGTGSCGGICDGNGSCRWPDGETDCGNCARCNGGGECQYVVKKSDPDNDCGNCQTCNGSGNCIFVEVGADTHDDCNDEGVSDCGHNGECNGNGVCDYYGLNEETGAFDISQPASCQNTVVLELADTCDGKGNIVDGGVQICTPYTCVTDDCTDSCGSHADCASNSFCDFSDLNQNGRSDDCVVKRNNGSQCNTGNGYECKGGVCNNGFCCSDPGGDCCGSSGNCQHLTSAAVCDYAKPGGCDGHRVDAFCDGNKVCKTTEVDDDTACASLECEAQGCFGTGLLFTQERYCDAGGKCSLGGSAQSCNDGNTCTNDFCDTNAGCSHTDNDAYVESCYEGPAGTAGNLPCKAGTRTCQAGVLGLCQGQFLPDSETCDGVDNDCDGVVDEEGSDGCTVFFRDEDGDGWGTNDYRCLCNATGVYSAIDNGDCDDSQAGANPGNVFEECGTPYDDNCNSQAQEDGANGCSNYYFDGDGDGYGVGTSACKCSPEAPFTAGQQGDCNDGNSQVNPGQTEKCNGYDDNCKNGIDTAELSEAQLCGTPSHATPGCSAGVCYIKKCDIDFFNMDGVFSNGCEASLDQWDKAGWGDFCGHGQYQSAGVGQGNYQSQQYIHKGQWHTVTGSIVPHGDVDWFKTRFIDNGTLGRDFHLDIRFTSNPGDAFRFDVYRDSCGNKVCGSTKFYDVYSDFNYSGGKGNQNCSGGCSDGWCGYPGANCCCRNTEGSDRDFFIRVFRPDAQSGGDEYKLFVSNNYY